MNVATINIESLKVSARIGCIDAEREIFQSVIVHLSIKYNAEEAIKTDNITAAVNYVSVAELVTKMAAEQKWKLIEKMGFDIATHIKELSKNIQSIEITIKKFVVAKADSVSCNLIV